MSVLTVRAWQVEVRCGRVQVPPTHSWDRESQQDQTAKRCPAGQYRSWVYKDAVFVLYLHVLQCAPTYTTFCSTSAKSDELATAPIAFQSRIKLP
jgi:hypothetical protein